MTELSSSNPQSKPKQAHSPACRYAMPEVGHCTCAPVVEPEAFPDSRNRNAEQDAPVVEPERQSKRKIATGDYVVWERHGDYRWAFDEPREVVAWSAHGNPILKGIGVYSAGDLRVVPAPVVEPEPVCGIAGCEGKHHPQDHNAAVEREQPTCVLPSTHDRGCDCLVRGEGLVSVEPAAPKAQRDYAPTPDAFEYDIRKDERARIVTQLREARWEDAADMIEGAQTDA